MWTYRRYWPRGALVTWPAYLAARKAKRLSEMKAKKAADMKGLSAEMLKEGGVVLSQIIADLFNEMLAPDAVVPGYWKETRLKVLFEKGDPSLPDNYRPIAILFTNSVY